MYFKGLLNYDAFLSLKLVFIEANSADTDEMQPLNFFLLLRGFSFAKRKNNLNNPENMFK